MIFCYCLGFQTMIYLPTNSSPGQDIILVNPTPRTREWCISKSNADQDDLQKNINYVCGMGIDCREIQTKYSCFVPNTVLAHATYAMNNYY